MQSESLNFNFSMQKKRALQANVVTIHLEERGVMIVH